MPFIWARAKNISDVVKGIFISSPNMLNAEQDQLVLSLQREMNFPLLNETKTILPRQSMNFL
jgi:hypothetical protein